MKTSEIVEGFKYTNNTKRERYVVEVIEGDVVYLEPFGLCKQCSLKAFARWAKERIS